MRRKRALHSPAARTKQEKLVQEQPNYGPVLWRLGLIDARLGERKKHCGKDASVSNYPCQKDSIMALT